MPSRRPKAQVNYAVFDPEQGPPITFSDDDEFQPEADDDADMDLDLGDLVDEHESPPPQEPEEESEEEQAPKKRVPKSKVKVESSTKATRSTPNVPKPPPVMASTPTQPLSKRQPTNESFGERFRLMLGEDERVLVEAIENRVNWANVAFVPEQDIVERPKKFGTDFEPVEGAVSPARSTLNIASSEVWVDGSAVLLNDKLLGAGETMSTQDVLLLNAGSFCKDARWVPFRSGPLQYLAITVIPGDPIDADAADISLGAFKHATSESVVYFYEFNTDDQTLKLHALIDCGERGPIVNLRWRPCRESECAVVFQSGHLALLPIPEPGSHTLDANLAPCRDISCVTWAGPDQLLCGTKDGYVLRLSTGFEVLAYQQSHLSLMSDIAVSYPCPEGLETVCTCSTDGDTKVTDLNDPTKYSAVVRSKTFIANACYLPSLNCYATQDDSILTRLVFARTPAYNSGTQLTRHEASVNAMAASVFHPFVLTGSTDGSLCLVNALRRALTPKRNLKTEKDIMLWSLECEERTRKYRFHEKLAVGEFVAKLKAPEVLRQSPQTCTVTSIDWLQAKSAAGWYAASTASGIIRIEKLN